MQVGDIIVIVDMDTDPGSSGVSTLAAREANRARQRQRFESETPEEREDRLARRRARRRERIASELAEQRETHLAADRARRRRRITSESAEQREIRLSRRRARSADPVKEALCNREEYKKAHCNTLHRHTPRTVILTTLVSLYYSKHH